jgi:hypothetical protein
MMINNLPAYAKEYKYIVVRKIDKELWFWGAWNNMDEASEAAIEINGMVVTNELPPFFYDIF